MLMARDTAKDLIDQGTAKLEKIRKQTPKGDDPIEIIGNDGHALWR